MAVRNAAWRGGGRPSEPLGRACAPLAVEPAPGEPALSLTLASAGEGTAGEAPEIRVLLLRRGGARARGIAALPRTIELNGAHQLVIEGVGRGARWHPEGSGPWQVGSQRVRGRIAVRAREGRIQVLNRVALEDYVASTVGGEMAPSWPEEALRAQAVATRTYVLHEAAKRRNADWDVRATATSQVYGGMRAETRETRARPERPGRGAHLRR